MIKLLIPIFMLISGLVIGYVVFNLEVWHRIAVYSGFVPQLKFFQFCMGGGTTFVFGALAIEFYQYANKPKAKPPAH